MLLFCGSFKSCLDSVDTHNIHNSAKVGRVESARDCHSYDVGNIGNASLEGFGICLVCDEVFGTGLVLVSLGVRVNSTLLLLAEERLISLRVLWDFFDLLTGIASSYPLSTPLFLYICIISFRGIIIS